MRTAARIARYLFLFWFSVIVIFVAALGIAYVFGVQVWP